jgi:UDP:flavonoid glycosyltransferase YjiC (YdhE family)
MRWLLSSWGSRGDLHPFLALGRGLVARGHEVTVVGHPEWAADTGSAGLRFVATNEPPRGDIFHRHPEILSSRWGGIPCLRTLVREVIAPGFPPLLAALLAEAPRHDAVIAHHFAFPAAIAAEVAGKPWVTVTLAPGVIPSAYALPGAQFGRAGSGVLARTRNRVIWSAGRLITGRMVDPLVNQLRREHGLRPVCDAVFGAHSPLLNLQLYSRHFAPPAPDWSAEKKQAGFCFFDPPGAELDAEIETFLGQGEPPVLFTLGSTASHNPGGFYEEAVDVCRRLKVRGLLLIGPEENRPRALPPNVLAANYAPYGLLMPRTRAVVHQCGIGTLSHALRAGLPSIAVPFAFDQPNNACRMEELGVAELVRPAERNGATMARALHQLLGGPAVTNARKIGGRIRRGDGVVAACDLLEESLACAS